MTMAKTLLGAVCAIAFTGCAVDLGTTDRELDTLDNESGSLQCPVTSFNLIDRDYWALDGVTIAGEYFTKDDLIGEAEDSPTDPYTDLRMQVAAVYNNQAVGLELPDDVIDAVVAAEAILATDLDRNQRTSPPVVSTDLIDTLDSFNTDAAVQCLEGGLEAALVDEPLSDTREDIFHRDF